MAGVVKLSGLRPRVPACRHGWSCPTPHAVNQTISAYPGGRDKSPSRQVSEPIDVRRLCDDFMIGWHQDPGVDAALAQGWWQAGRCFLQPSALGETCDLAGDEERLHRWQRIAFRTQPPLPNNSWLWRPMPGTANTTGSSDLERFHCRQQTR
jgi:hypothetical protein